MTIIRQQTIPLKPQGTKEEIETPKNRVHNHNSLLQQGVIITIRRLEIHSQPRTLLHHQKSNICDVMCPCLISQNIAGKYQTYFGASIVCLKENSSNLRKVLIPLFHFCMQIISNINSLFQLSAQDKLIEGREMLVTQVPLLP